MKNISLNHKQNQSWKSKRKLTEIFLTEIKESFSFALSLCLVTKKEAENERNPNSEPEIVQKRGLKKSQGSLIAKARKDTIQSFTFFSFPPFFEQPNRYLLRFN